MSEVEQSSEEKTEWLQKYLRKRQPQAIVFDHEKYKYAQQPNETPNILIDDYETNIRLWEANGGIGILYKPENYKQVLHRLHQFQDTPSFKLYFCGPGRDNLVFAIFLLWNG